MNEVAQVLHDNGFEIVKSTKFGGYPAVILAIDVNMTAADQLLKAHFDGRVVWDWHGAYPLVTVRPLIISWR